jgi:hypothetical protein
VYQKLAALLGFLIFLGGVFFGGYRVGVKDSTEAANEQAEKRIQLLVKEGIDRANIGPAIERALGQKLGTLRVNNDEIIRNIKTLVRDNGCRFDASFGVLHNAAARGGRLPDATGRDDGTAPAGAATTTP